MKKALCDKILALVSDVDVRLNIEEVTKAEIDNSYSSFDHEIVEFKTTSGLTIRISVTSPKPPKQEVAAVANTEDCPF